MPILKLRNIEQIPRYVFASDASVALPEPPELESDLTIPSKQYTLHFIWILDCSKSLAENGKIQMPTIKSYPFEEEARAHRELQSGMTTGKIVLVL